MKLLIILISLYNILLYDIADTNFHNSLTKYQEQLLDIERFYEGTDYSRWYSKDRQEYILIKFEKWYLLNKYKNNSYD